MLSSRQRTKLSSQDQHAWQRHDAVLNHDPESFSPGTRQARGQRLHQWRRHNRHAYSADHDETTSDKQHHVDQGQCRPPQGRPWGLTFQREQPTLTKQQDTAGKNTQQGERDAETKAQGSGPGDTGIVADHRIPSSRLTAQAHQKGIVLVQRFQPGGLSRLRQQQ